MAIDLDDIPDDEPEARRSNGQGGSNAAVKLFQIHPEGGGAYGGRDNALAAFVGYCRNKRLDFEAGMSWAQDWNKRYCRPPLDFDAVDEKVRRAWATWADDGRDDATPEEYAPKKKAQKPERKLMTIDELLDLPDAEAMNWLVPNVFVKQGIHFVSAPAAGAKSWLMLDLARSIAAGKPWLDQYEVEQGSVLYVDEEMGENRTARRVRQLGFGKGVPFYYLGKQGIQINDPDDLKFIVNLCLERNVSLCCLDTLTGVRPGLQENESSHVSALRAYFNDITNTGATLLVAHHDRKGGQGESEVAHYRMAGSRDFGAMADMAYGIEKRGSYFHLEITKNRHLAEEDALRVDFALEDNDDKTRVTLRIVDASERSEMTLDALGGRIMACLRQNGKMNTSTLCDNVKGSPNAVSAAAQRLVEKGELTVEKVGRQKFFDVNGAF